MKTPLGFRLKLALLTGILRLLGRVIHASTSATKLKAARPDSNGRLIDGESRRIDERYGA